MMYDVHMKIEQDRKLLKELLSQNTRKGLIDICIAENMPMRSGMSKQALISEIVDTKLAPRIWNEIVGIK